MTARLTPEQIDLVVSTLMGSCSSDQLGPILGDGFESMSFSDLHVDDLAAITQEVDLCGGCGWWHEASELDEADDGPLCPQCVVDAT